MAQTANTFSSLKALFKDTYSNCKKCGKKYKKDKKK